jgi:hypothetical protein
MADAGTDTQKIARRLTYIQNAWKRASTAIGKITEAQEAIRIQTNALREALHAIARNTECAHLILDSLETSSGLVDEDGKRFDEVE